MAIFAFSLMRSDEEMMSEEVTNGRGSAKVVASLLRAAADELDPPSEAPGYKLGQQYGEQLMRDIFGNLGKKS